MVTLVLLLAFAPTIFVFTKSIALCQIQVFRLANSMRLFSFLPYIRCPLVSTNALLAKLTRVRLRADAFTMLKFSLSIWVARISSNKSFNLVLRETILVDLTFNQKLLRFWNLAIKFEAVAIHFVDMPIYLILVFTEGEIQY